MNTKEIIDKIKSLVSSPIGAKAKPNHAPESVLSCDLGKSKMVFLEILKSPSGMELVQFQKIIRPTDETKLAEVLSQTRQSSNFGTSKVRLSIKGQGVVVRFIQFPKMKPEELRGALTFESEKYIPFKSEEVVIDYHIIEEDPSNAPGKLTSLLLVAVKKDEIYNLVKNFQNAGFQVELIDIDSLAFFNGLEFFHPEDCRSSVGLLDIGTDISTLVITRSGMPRFIRDISFGGADLVKRLKRKLGMSEKEAFEQLEVDREPSQPAMEVLKEGIKSLVADFKVSVDYYMDQMQPPEGVKKLFLGGAAGYLPFVIKAFSEDLGFPVQSMDLGNKISIKQGLDQDYIKKNQALLHVALGLCLRDL